MLGGGLDMSVSGCECVWGGGELSMSMSVGVWVCGERSMSVDVCLWGELSMNTRGCVGELSMS